MLKIMSSVFLFVALATLFVNLHAGQDQLQEFCTILLQSLYDMTQCFEKPTTYSTTSGDNFILAYFCCEGYWDDVTNNYMPYLNYTFLQYQIQLTNETLLRDHAYFIRNCTSGLNGYLLTELDYLNWANNGRTPNRCRV